MIVLVLNFRQLVVSLGSGKTHCKQWLVHILTEGVFFKAPLESTGLYYWDSVVQILSCNNPSVPSDSVYTQCFISDNYLGILHTWYLLPQLYVQVAQTGPRKHQGGIARERCRNSSVLLGDAQIHCVPMKVFLLPLQGNSRLHIVLRLCCFLASLCATSERIPTAHCKGWGKLVNKIS